MDASKACAHNFESERLLWPFPWEKLGKQDDLHVENKYETVNASLASEWTYACKICQGAARRFRFHGL